MEVVTVADRSNEFDAVVALSKRHQATLGQLPYEAFHTFARERRVLAALIDGTLAGYLIYRMRKRTGVPVLVHLCLEPTHRRQGIADRLVAEVVSRHPYAPGIAAWCREDYPAHKAWPRLGFHHNADRPGRNQHGHRLIHWWRPINDLTLFTYDPGTDDVPAAAIDTNVFRDIVEPREAFPESQALDDDWLTDVVELVVTGQLVSEIHEASMHVPALAGTPMRFKQLTPATEDWLELYDILRPALPQLVCDNDVRHLAQASAGNARYFVTRDQPILAAGPSIEALTGVVVISPIELVLSQHSDQHQAAYRPEALYETELRLRHLSVVPTIEQLQPFTDHETSERTAELRQIMISVASRSSTGGQLWLVERTAGRAIALAAVEPDGDALVVRAVRARSGRDRDTFVRQMAHRFRSEARRHGRSWVRVIDPVPRYTSDALVAEGYRLASDGWVADCSIGMCAPTDVISGIQGQPTADSLTPIDVSLSERQLWPLKIISGNVPTYIVPIQARWARDLFGAEAQQSLIPRLEGLGLAREHVYYRAVVRHLETPARLLWFVTKGGRSGGMCAVSWLDDVVNARPRTLYRRFGPQGVYQLSDLEPLVRAPGGEVTAMLFSRTEVFAHRTPLREATSIYPPIGSSQYLRTSRRVDEHVFADFYRIGQPLL